MLGGMVKSCVQGFSGGGLLAGAGLEDGPLDAFRRRRGLGDEPEGFDDGAGLYPWSSPTSISSI
jgi:hypothetical protein